MIYSESDTRANHIDPQLQQNWWMQEYIIREHYFTDGRKFVWGKRWPRCYADYILKYNWVKLAIIEAKSDDKEPTEWLEQVKNYWNKLQIRFLYATNGKKITENSRKVKVSDIKDYDLSAKNPNKIKEQIHRAPKDILWDIEKNNEKITGIVSELKKIIG
jgi:type I restriction enzyme R subunit